MSLARTEAPPKKLSVSRSNAVDVLRFRNLTSNQDTIRVVGLQDTVNGANGVAFQSVRTATATPAAFIGVRDTEVTPTTLGYVGERNISIVNGFATRAWGNYTITIPSGVGTVQNTFGGVIQIGDFSDEGGATVTVTLPTTAEVLANMVRGANSYAWFDLIQAATNVADQVDIVNSDLNAIRINQSGATGTAVYRCMFTHDGAGNVDALIFQYA